MSAIDLAFDHVDELCELADETVDNSRRRLAAEKLQRDRPAFLKFVRQHRQEQRQA